MTDEKPADKPDIVNVPIDMIEPGPVRSELTPEQSKRLKVIWDICGHVNSDTFEQFEVDFMRDIDPESEIQIWERIAAAFYKAMKHFPDTMPMESARKIVASFVLLSACGVDAQLPFNLPAYRDPKPDISQADWLRECWRNPTE